MVIKTNTIFAKEARDRLIFTTTEKDDKTLKVFSANNSRLYNLIQPFFRQKDYLNEASDVFVYPNDTTPKRIAFVHLKQKSEDEKITMQDFRIAASCVINKVRSRSIEVDLTAISAMQSHFNLSEEEIVKSLCQGFLLTNYSFNKYQQQSKSKHSLQEICFINEDNNEIKSICHEESVVCGYTIKARDLTNEPSNVLTTEAFSKTSSLLAKAVGVTIKVLNKAEISKAGMGGILAVNAGSSQQQEARLVALEYNGIPKKQKDAITVLLVGKGVVFDTGGISLKPAAGMGDMKMDMAGGACALCSILAVAANKLAINVRALIPLTDNKPSATAINPGDVITMYNGTTVEVDNTDAEGRLILADALAYGIKTYKPTYVVDIATLTGACIIALGNQHAGLFANNDKLLTNLIDAGKATGETVWPLPLDEEYKTLIKSDIADLKNVGGRAAGTITAAKFLQQFVAKTAWAHLDIAGTAILDKPNHYLPKGGSGYGVRLLHQWLKKLSHHHHHHQK